VKIRVYRTEGTSTGDTVYLGSKCLTDYGDIRFTDNDANEIPYWIESVSGTLATIWVKVPSISDTTIWIYYGNESASTTSNGNTTFLLFDHFNDGTVNASLWTTQTGTISETATEPGYVTVTNTTTDIKGIKSAATFSAGTAILTRFNVSSTSTSYYPEVGFDAWSTAGVTITGVSGYFKGTTYDGTQATINVAIIDTSIHRFDIQWISNSLCKYNIDGGSYVSLTTNIPTTAIPVTIRPYGAISIVCDYIAVRSITATPETHGSWSTEQEVTTYPLRITITPTSGTDPLNVSYNLSINEALDDFVLNYGDGQEYTGDDITSFATTHTYNTPGTYTVWAEGYNEFATHVFYEIPYGVTVNAEAVVASFSVDQTYNTVTFTNTSTGNINECYWDFGDGNHSYEQNPVHTYYSPATYTVTLYASNQYQYDHTTDDITITQILTAPDAYFTPAALNVINPTLPYSVTFTNLSTPSFGCTYNWLIDDTTYTTENPSHSFATYGMYDVGLTVTNALGSSTRSYTDAIKITRKGRTMHEVVGCADDFSTFGVRVFDEYPTYSDLTIVYATILPESICFVQSEIPEAPGIDEWGVRNLYSTINEWGIRIFNTLNAWGHRILHAASANDYTPLTMFHAKEFREDIIIADEWQFGTE